MADTHHHTSGVTREIKGLMGKEDATQGDLAEWLDCSQPSVSRRLKGEVDWTLGELFTLAEHFDVPVTDLFPDQGSRSSGWVSGSDLVAAA